MTIKKEFESIKEKGYSYKLLNKKTKNKYLQVVTILFDEFLTKEIIEGKPIYRRLLVNKLEESHSNYNFSVIFDDIKSGEKLLNSLKKNLEV